MNKEMWMGVGGLAVVLFSIPTALIILALTSYTVGGVVLAGLVSLAGGASGAYLVKVIWEFLADRVDNANPEG